MWLCLHKDMLQQEAEDNENEEVASESVSNTEQVIRSTTTLPIYACTLRQFMQVVTVCFQRIEELESHGIAAVDIKKLKAAGFHTVESVILPYRFIYFYSIEELKNQVRCCEL